MSRFTTVLNRMLQDECGYSIERLHQATGLDTSHIRQILWGERTPKLSTVWVLAEAISACSENAGQRGKTTQDVFRALAAAMILDAERAAMRKQHEEERGDEDRRGR